MVALAVSEHCGAVRQAYRTLPGGEWHLLLSRGAYPSARASRDYRTRDWSGNSESAFPLTPIPGVRHMSTETTTPYTVVLRTADGLTELASAQVIIGPALFKTPEAAAYLGLASGTLAAWRMEGTGPRYARLGKGSRSVIGYRREDLDAFIAAHMN